MSIIFGVLTPEGDRVDRQFLAHLANATGRYAPDGTLLHAEGRIGMGFQPYSTHARSRHEAQPLKNSIGDLLVFDGRLDNYAEIAQQLDLEPESTSDSAVVLKAFRNWGERCFSRFVGDWAIALWSHGDRSLYLARDHASTRTLYYELRCDRFIWSTSLETFFTNGRTQQLDEAYLAAYLVSRSTHGLTPYKDIKEVLPAHYLKFEDTKFFVQQHWSPLFEDQIRYKHDEEYDDHFLHVFQQAVARRTDPGAPILAHLSGGMDSTSIVCMSDRLRRQHGAQTSDLLDTLSLYDDSEENWDDRLYFTSVESWRGKAGFHFDVSSYPRTMQPVDPGQATYLLPGADRSAPGRELAMSRVIAEKGYRVIVSGIGGDEVLGGVPTGIPELGNYLVKGQMMQLLRRAFEWSLADRVPLVHTLWKTARDTGDLYQRPHQDQETIPPWLIKSRLPDASEVPLGRISIFKHSPSVVSNARAWWTVLETMPHLFPEFLSRLEYRYPYLDRDLVEYLLRVTRSQIVGPGRRRLLMRRALKGIVPHEILERRRKAFVVRKLFTSLEIVAADVEKLITKSPLVERGWIDPHSFHKALTQTLTGTDLTFALPLLRTVYLNLWLLSRDSMLHLGSTPSVMEPSVSDLAGLARTR